MAVADQPQERRRSGRLVGRCEAVGVEPFGLARLRHAGPEPLVVVLGGKNGHGLLAAEGISRKGDAACYFAFRAFCAMRRSDHPHWRHRIGMTLGRDNAHHTARIVGRNAIRAFTATRTSVIKAPIRPRDGSISNQPNDDGAKNDDFNQRISHTALTHPATAISRIAGRLSCDFGSLDAILCPHLGQTTSFANSSSFHWLSENSPEEGAGSHSDTVREHRGQTVVAADGSTEMTHLHIGQATSRNIVEPPSAWVSFLLWPQAVVRSSDVRSRISRPGGDRVRAGHRSFTSTAVPESKSRRRGSRRREGPGRGQAGGPSRRPRATGPGTARNPRTPSSRRRSSRSRTPRR